MATYFDQLHGRPQVTHVHERKINIFVMCTNLVLCARVACEWPRNWL